MELNHLKAFIAVADYASFSQAAESLHLTQPAISKRIAALEQSLGATLFDRMGRSILLTEAGSVLLPAARRICSDLQHIEQTINRLGHSVAGRLSIGTSHHIGLHRLPPVLREFTATYPGVELDLHFMDSEDACARVEDNSLELALVTLPEKEFARLGTQLIWPDPLQIVTEINHPLSLKKNPKPHDLGEFPAIVPSSDTVTRKILDKALLPYGIKLKVAMETNYIETIKTMVSVGLGWSAIPKIMVGDELASISIKDIELQRRLGIVFHRGRSLSAAAKAFIETLKIQSASRQPGG